MEEIWKDIKNYEGLYQVSNLGRVKSLERYKQNRSKKQLVPEKILNQEYHTEGYKQVGLSKDGKSSKFRVHRLVAEAFIPNPNNYPFVNHKDETRDNNIVDNLEWCTPKYNVNYGTSIEKMSKKVCQYDLQGNLIKIWPSGIEIYRQLGFDFSTISKCCLGKIKRYKGFVWKYSKVS